ncbi:unnamed protein product [Adineta steineri]|uniref:Uncharacterized protein n=3 Tax=Adineta steineri TaxID=433720 RepID=A0A819PLF7_9BILA|nr:unnamed protein product [Adineta steineri]CAF4009902.1 unnamed protein product [Adineta steineri]
MSEGGENNLNEISKQNIIAEFVNVASDEAYAVKVNNASFDNYEESDDEEVEIYNIFSVHHSEQEKKRKTAEYSKIVPNGPGLSLNVGYFVRNDSTIGIIPFHAAEKAFSESRSLRNH